MNHEGDERVLRQLTNSSMAPWLVVNSGTMRGVYGGGKVTAHEMKGVTKGYAGMVGVSTGAPTASYALAGQAELGTSIYYEECTKPEFLSFRRIWGRGHVADVGYLANVFRHGPKRLDQEALYATDTELWFGVTEYATATEHFVNAKSVFPDIVHGIHASIAMPGLYRSKLYIDNVRCNDGGVACRPIRFALTKKPTGVVVLANCTKDAAESFGKRVLVQTLTLREVKAQRKALARRYANAAEDFQELRESGVPHLIVYSDSVVGSYTRDPVVLKAAAERSNAYMCSLMDRAGV